MTGEDFISFSGRIAAQTAFGAAGYRSAVSRAYYGAFHCAREFLARQFSFHCRTREQEHLWLQRHFLNCSVPDAHDVGKLLETLHAHRKKADYDLSATEADAQSHAMACVLRAEQVRRKLQSCSSDLATIESEMLDWRRRANVT